MIRPQPAAFIPGAKRWISVGHMQFQPSEWVKLVLILAVARYFANLGGRSLTWRDIFKAFVLVGLPMMLVLLQPDLGTALVLVPLAAVGAYLAGLNWKHSLAIVCAPEFHWRHFHHRTNVAPKTLRGRVVEMIRYARNR